MPYNPYFPAAYQQYQQMPTQTRTVEAIPVDNEDAVVSFPVAVGATVMLVAKDDHFVAFKTNGMNGESTVSFYDKRPPAPPTPVFDPKAYVTRDELESRLAAILKPQTRNAVKEAE